MTQTKDDTGLPPISVGVINFNGKKIIERTLNSILESGYPEIDLMVVDDVSTDDGIEMVREKFPSVRVFIQERNMGPNAARNRALKEAKHDMVFVTDNDITLGPDCLKILVKTMLAEDDIGAVTPMVLDAVEKNRIYANYVGLYYLCFGIIPDRYQNLSPDMDLDPRSSVCGSGGIMLTKKSVAERLGWFDEDLYFGYTDGEYTFRITASGSKVMQAPKAKIYHLEKAGREITRLRYQIRGRWHFILKHYSARTLFLLIPAFLFFEAGNLGYLTLKGALGEWFRGVGMVI
ncbi:hypothetical protein MNBD_NITROSPINAE02-1362, partial [hydrothermal vent metagenome]